MEVPDEGLSKKPSLEHLEELLAKRKHAIEEGDHPPHPVRQDSVADASDSKGLQVIPPRVLYGVYSTKGKRKSNEDAHLVLIGFPEEPSIYFFGLYDGHSGRKASHYCQKKLHHHIAKQKSFPHDIKKAIVDGFIRTDEKFLEEGEEDGTTVLVGLLMQDNKLYVGNAGDSRCIVVRGHDIIPMSHDHKPYLEIEKKRIEASGHEVQKEKIIMHGQRMDVYRVDGKIAVSRAIGDSEFKDSHGCGPEKQAISCVPDILEAQVQTGDYVIMACDGLWDVISNENVRDYIEKNKNTKKPEEIAYILAKEALRLESDDNVTVLVVQIL